MIGSFADRSAQQLWETEKSKVYGQFARVALRKLMQLNAAEQLDDLKMPPGNRLEALKGNRAGQHSIRANQQWRICFVWKDGGARDVEIVDYH